MMYDTFLVLLVFIKVLLSRNMYPHTIYYGTLNTRPLINTYMIRLSTDSEEEKQIHLSNDPN